MKLQTNTLDVKTYATSLTQADMTAIKAARKGGKTTLVSLLTHCQLDHKIMAVAAFLGIPRENITQYTHPRMYCRIETYLLLEGVAYPPGYVGTLQRALGTSFSTSGVYQYSEIAEAHSTYGHVLDMKGEQIDDLVIPLE